MRHVHGERLVTLSLSRRTNSVATVVASLLAAGGATKVHAVDFQHGELNGSWDTTLSYGQLWRIEDPDCHLIATANGGCGRSANIDDGDLNYHDGVVSRALKAVTELSLEYRNFGAFVRASGLYDYETKNEDTQRTPLSKSAKDLVAQYTRLLDAFGYARFELGTLPAELRLGRQVLSWGESTFIQGGLNAINHFDVSALRVPGSELKEAFLPQEMAVFNLQFNENLSTQLVYLLDWNDTQPEPAGSFFSTNDFATPGGERVLLGFGAFSGPGRGFSPARRPVHRRLPERGSPRDAQAQRQRSGRHQFQAVPAELQQRHRVRVLLPELSQPAAGDLRVPPARRPAWATPSAR